MVRALFFDINDTLINHTFAQDKAIKKLAKHLPHIDESIFYKAWKEISSSFWKLFEEKKITYDDQRIRRVASTWERFNTKLTAKDNYLLADNYLRYYEQALCINLTLKQELEASLKNGVIVGIISNGYGPLQRKRLSAVGLKKYFTDKFIFISDEVGIEKPDGKIFELAENAVGIPPLQLTMYGDDYTNDIEPSKKRGWNTVHITTYL